MPEDKKTNHKHELLGIFLILFSLFLMLALITHSPADYSQVSYPTNTVTANKAGQIGAAISYFFFLMFGLSSFIITLFIGFWGVLLVIRRQIQDMPVKLISVFFFSLSLITLLSLITPDKFSDWRLSRSMETFGGFSGYLLTSFTTKYFGYLGSYALALFVMLFAAILATDWLAYEVVRKISKLLMPLLIKLASVLVAQVKRLKMRHQPSLQVLPGHGTVAVMPPESETSIDEETEELTDSGEPVAGVTVKLKCPRQDKIIRPVSSFKLPPLDLLEDAEPTAKTDDRDTKEQVESIEATLKNFGVSAKLVNLEHGPVITKYELELGPGISIHKVASMADDFAIALKAPNVRIVAPIPGKSTIGIEVPNAYKGIVRLKELLIPGLEESHKLALPLFIGKDAAGTPLTIDLEDMPHLLIAGTTGSGKSICIGSVILSLLMTRTPEELKFLLIDPKMVELSAFKDIPHLISPVVTDMRRSPLVLKWLVRTMNERYELLLRTGVKKISDFNRLSEDKIRERLSEDGELPVDVPTRLPYIMVVIDEFADLMMAASDEIETAITRLSQKSRAVGIHLVMATQRPSVDVITGLIKSNMPARIAFKVASKVDSRTILDRNGSEKLLGLGDMLLLLPSSTEMTRAQGTFVSDKEIHEVVTFLKSQGEPTFDEELLSLENKDAIEEMEDDPMFDDAVKIVLETQRGSVSLIQRRLAIGYTRAARLMDMMGRLGIVGAYKNSKAREVIMTLAEWENAKTSLRK